MRNKALFGIAAVLLGMSAASAAWAISETNYAQVFEQKVWPYFQSVTDQSFEGVDGIRISYRIFKTANARASIILLEGKSESYAKSAETIYDLHQLGFNVYAMDHRGQGASDRLLSDPALSQFVHVEVFDDYVTDARTFLDQVVKPDLHGASKPFVLAHSLGGAVATLLAVERSGDLQGLLLVSPMYEINFKGVPESVIEAGVEFQILGGHADSPVLSSDTFHPDQPCSESITTQSCARFKERQALSILDPHNAMGGPTNRWVEQALAGDRELRDSAPRVTAPVLIMAAGADQAVMIAREKSVCAEMPSCHIETQPFEAAFHSILSEKDIYRDAALRLVGDFIAAHL